jgi:GNAT superfamily N-acetyltransferase
MAPAAYLDALETRRLLVAADADGRVLGYGQLAPDEGVIEAVYVDPDFARRGVGRRLVTALEDEARALGLPGLMLDASLNSVPFYGALGYAHECWSRHSLGEGRSIACATMTKRLGPASP